MREHSSVEHRFGLRALSWRPDHNLKARARAAAAKTVRVRVRIRVRVT
jgi:hypothetical protein